MSASIHNPLQAIRRFVELRSAWRRSLALEPREKPPAGGCVPNAGSEAEPRGCPGSCHS